MSDYLLVGWEEIHEELFLDRRGRPAMSLSTLRQKHGPGLKACGAIFKWHRGRVGRPIVAGWRSIIQNYFIKLGQKVEAEKAKEKGYNQGRL